MLAAVQLFVAGRRARVVDHESVSVVERGDFRLSSGDGLMEEGTA